MDPKQLALMMLQRNPQISSTPMGKQFLHILQTGDQQAGIQMAQNLCASRGITPEQAFQMAKTQFNI